MKVTKPLALTLTNSNVTESTYDEWNVATEYDPGDKVKYDPTSSLVYHEFEALTTHTGTTPAIGGGIDWLDLGPANARAMFDGKTGSQTLIDEELVFTVIPGAFFTTVALLNITGAHSANVLIEYGATTLYDETFDISGNAEDWDQYFFGEDEDNLAALSVVPGIFGDDTPGRAALILDPAIFYATATVTITLTGSAGTDVGDAFGNTYLLERPYADTVTAQMILDSVQVDAVRRELAKYRATPVLYDLNNSGSNYESLLVFGFFESFEISLALASKSYCDLRVQSLI